MKDCFGNEKSMTIERNGNKIIERTEYTLEPGKTTLRGQFKKFRNDVDCPFPERLDCNYGTGYERCKFMEFLSFGDWRCKFNKAQK